MSTLRRKGRALKGMAVDRLDGVGSPAHSLPFLIKKSDDPDEIRDAATAVQEKTSEMLMNLFKTKGLTLSPEVAEEMAALAESVGIEGYEEILKEATMPKKKAPKTLAPGAKALFGKKKTAAEPDAETDEETEEEETEEEALLPGIDTAAVQKMIAREVKKSIDEALVPLISAITDVASLVTGEEVTFEPEGYEAKTEKKKTTETKPLSNLGGSLRVSKEDVSSRQPESKGDDILRRREKAGPDDDSGYGTGMFTGIIFGANAQPQ